MMPSAKVFLKTAAMALVAIALVRRVPVLKPVNDQVFGA